jgi:TRAP-type C4-dicarboxylate transport system permease small subunit
MLQKSLDALFKAGIVISAISMSGICLLIMAQIIGRWFGLIIPSSEDFSGYLLAASLFYALPYSYRHNSHIRVVFLLGRLNTGKRLWVERINLTLLLVLTSYCTYALAAFCLETYEFHEVSTGFVAVPLWIPQSSMVIGMALFLLAVLQDWLVIMLGREPSFLMAEKKDEGGSE